MTWLAETPRALVRAHLLMLKRLQAEESLAEANRVAVGSGTLNTEASRALVNGWLRASRGGDTSEATSGRQLARAAANAGIKVRTVKRDG